MATGGGEHARVDPVLYLASTSPRRHALLAAAGIVFEPCEPGAEYVSAGTDEHTTEAGDPSAHAVARAVRKAIGAAVSDPTRPVLAVDTVVDLDGIELGKARSREHAKEMLLALAGRTHRVHTAHCLHARASGFRDVVVSHAVVACGTPSTADLDRYLDSGEWRGKAGSYGIQDTSQHFLGVVEGSLGTVIGLEIEVVLAQLARWRGTR